MRNRFLILLRLTTFGFCLFGTIAISLVVGADIKNHDINLNVTDSPIDSYPVLKKSPYPFLWESVEKINPGSGEDSHVEIPEPLLFDLVRPLGAKQGEIEINTLSLFPWSQSNANPKDSDPFGIGPTTPDRKGIEWAPEIEYAIADNFAIEFELPFENSSLEEYKLGLQWTIGTAFNNHYIHGFQMLVEPTVEWDDWNTTLLYLGGIRFNDTWSCLFMLGGRMELDGSKNSQTFERILNLNLFANVANGTVLGVETNCASKLNGESSFIVIPQIHYDLTDGLQIQSGLGLGVFSGGMEQSFILRMIASW